jgi:hypothetical protein
MSAAWRDRRSTPFVDSNLPVASYPEMPSAAQRLISGTPRRQRWHVFDVAVPEFLHKLVPGHAFHLL